VSLCVGGRKGAASESVRVGPAPPTGSVRVPVVLPPSAMLDLPHRRLVPPPLLPRAARRLRLRDVVPFPGNTRCASWRVAGTGAGQEVGGVVGE
jgi:hypothetical protein